MELHNMYTMHVYILTMYTFFEGGSDVSQSAWGFIHVVSCVNNLFIFIAK